MATVPATVPQNNFGSTGSISGSATLNYSVDFKIWLQGGVVTTAYLKYIDLDLRGKRNVDPDLQQGYKVFYRLDFKHILNNLKTKRTLLLGTGYSTVCPDGLATVFSSKWFKWADPLQVYSAGQGDHRGDPHPGGDHQVAGLQAAREAGAQVRLFSLVT